MTDSKEKGRSKKKINISIILNACVWGGVIITTSLILRGTEYMRILIPVFSGGAFISVVLLGGFLFKK